MPTTAPSLTSPQSVMEAYLAELRARLRTLPSEQVTDIVEEIRSHIRDTAGAGGAMTEERVRAALGRLGPASALAGSYVTDNLLARAERHRMPWTILHAMFHWALLSVKGVFALVVCLVGYAFGASFVVAALVKPFNPKAGLWMIDGDTYSLALGLSKVPPQGHEVLGAWLIPIGIALGGGTIVATTFFAQWRIRRFRESRRLRAAA